MRATWLIAVTILAVLWVPVLILPVNPWVFSLPVLLTVGVIAGTIAYDRKTAAGNADARRRALTTALSERMRAANADQQRGITAMREDIRDAVAKLTGALPGQTPRRAVEALPWYLVLGPSQAGKSAMLGATGLEFGYTTPAVGARGSRGCRFWLAPTMAFIDTCGEYTTGGPAYAEWLALLRELETTRPSQTLHGLLAVLAADTLLQVSQTRPDELDALGKVLRERVDEVLGFLGIDVPVYLMVTRCDTLPGFMEFFSDQRSPAERGQVLGFTLPLHGKDDPVALSSKRLDELAAALSHRMYRRVQGRAHTEARASMYMFPQWFAGLRSALLPVLGRLFARNRFMDQVSVRGVFFVSAAEAVLVQGTDMPYAAAPTGQRGFFLRDFVRNILLPDREHARPSPSELLRRLHRALAVAAPLFGFALVFPVLGYHSYRENLKVLQDFRSALNSCVSSSPPVPLPKLDLLRASVDQIRLHERNGPPLYMRLGMYVGDEIQARTATAYAALIYREASQRVVERTYRELSHFATRYARPETHPSNDERIYYGESLRLYLLLTTPRTPDDPQLADAHQRAWFNAQIAQAWNAVYPTTHVPEVAARTRIVELYALVLAADQRLGYPRDLQLVARVRTILARVPP
jgi:type VI secretion system protein ImpL